MRKVPLARRTLLAASLALVPAARALAAPRRRSDLGLHVELLVLQAGREVPPTGIDPAVQAIGALAEPPFSSVVGWTVVDRSRSALSTDAPTRRPLGSSRAIVVTLRKILAADRFRLAMSFDAGRGEAPLLDVTTIPGEPVIVSLPRGDGPPLVAVATVIPRVPLR